MLPQDSQAPPDSRPVDLPASPAPRYNLAVVDTASKNSVALVRYIYADTGQVEELFTDYLDQKIKEM